MAQLKSLCLVLSGSVNSKAAYWQIIAAGHTQTSARLGEISHFKFHICFKDIGHMASSTKKCDHETSSFCVAFGSFGFFLTSTFPALKHHQACTRLQSASQLQLSIGAFGKTKLQKQLDPKTLYESILSSFFLRAHLPGRLFVQKGSIASA